MVTLGRRGILFDTAYAKGADGWGTVFRIKE